MITRLNALVALTSLLLASTANATGIEVGNGGSSVVCHDRKNKIVSVELFDLYEGRALRDSTYKESSVPYQDQARDYINLMAVALGHKPDTEGGLQRNLEQNFKNLKFIPSGTGLTPIKDIDSIVLPKSCSLVQTANFPDSPLDRATIYIDTDIWQAMSETQKAALLVHETVYQFLRNKGPIGAFVEVDSIRTRRVVSQLFAGVKPEPLNQIKDLQKGSTPLFCKTVDAIENERRSSGFLIYMDLNGGTNVQFLWLADRNLLTRTTLPAQIYSDGAVYAAGKVNSKFIDNMVVLMGYSNQPDGRALIRVTDANGYNKEEKIVCIPAIPGDYSQ